MRHPSIGALIFFMLAPSFGLAVGEPDDQRVRILVASLDKRIKEIDKGDIALPVLLKRLSDQVSPPDADKDPKKRIVIVVSVHRDQPVAFIEPEPEKIHFSVKLVDARLDSVLNQICSELKGVTLVRDEFIEIVPYTSALAEFGLKISDDLIAEKWINPNFRNGFNPDNYQPTMPLLIHRFFTRIPTKTALQQIAERYNQNIVIAPEAEAKLETLITARLVNVPIEAAVETLANMADLRLFHESNVFLVTTKEQAAILTGEREQRLKAQKRQIDRLIERIGPKFP